MKLLSKEIIERYFYEKGVFTYEIKKGQEISTAQETLTNLNKYNAILQP
jgi:hypothetical protein